MPRHRMPPRDRMGDERPDEGEGDARERTPRPGSPLLVLGFLAVLGGGFASGLVFLANAHLLGDGLASAEPPAIEVAASLNFTIRDRPARPSTRPCTSTAAAREEINEPCRASRDQILPALLAGLSASLLRLHGGLRRIPYFLSYSDQAPRIQSTARFVRKHAHLWNTTTCRQG